MAATPGQPPDWVYAYAAYAFCAAMIAIYAWERFNTPPTNRSSTRQLLYWQSCIGYILSALSLFAVLSLLLEQAVWRDLLRLKDNQSLPAPLLATLALTTLLPRVPILSRVDRWLLDLFLDWGAIPAEVKRRAAALTPHGFTVDGADLQRLAERCDGLFGETFASHLGDRRDTDLERSRLRFTRVVKLYLQIQDLGSEPRYSRFFDQHAEEYTALATETEAFIRSALGELDLAARLHTLAQSGYHEVVRDRQQNFANNCRQRFIALARFLARAVLRSESSEKDIVARLRRSGFPEAEPISAPVFPINSLTALGVGIFAYLALTGHLFSYLFTAAPSGPGTNAAMPGPFEIATKITLVRVATLALTVYLIQRYPFFRRRPGEPPRYFAYLVAGLAASALTVAAGLALHFFDSDLVAGVRKEGALVLLSLMLCTAVAFCCDDWAEETRPPWWLRPAEAVVCGLAMALGMVVVLAANLSPFQPTKWLVIAAFIGLPAALGAIVGACVPHIYRESHRVAAARRAEADREPPAPRIQPAPLIAEPLAVPRHARPDGPRRRRVARIATGRAG
ncbi:MAG: hypothetical protein AB7T18_10545 [Alphaproteobacteria bacterium]